MSSVDTTSFDAMLKEMFTTEAVQDLGYPSNPFFATVAKNEKVGGADLKVPVQYATPAGVSKTFSSASSAKNASSYAGFQIDLASQYGVLSISRKVMAVSADDQMAFAKAKVREIENLVKSVSRACAINTYRNKGGAIGKISATSNTGTATITLANTDDITNFEIGDTLQTATTDGTSGSVNSGTVVVKSVDRDAGTITATGNWTAGIASAAANDFIFKSGDFGAGASGLDGWLPTTAPTSGDSFFGVDRSVDPTRLAGVRFDGSNLSIKEALVRGASRLSREGGMPDKCFLNHAVYRALEIELGANVRYVNVETKDGQIGFKGLSLVCPAGELEVIADLNCPSDRAYLLTFDDWELVSPAPIPKLFDDDGVMIRESNSDSYEIRVGGYWNLVCHAPGHSAVVYNLAA